MKKKGLGDVLILVTLVILFETDWLIAQSNSFSARTQAFVGTYGNVVIYEEAKGLILYNGNSKFHLYPKEKDIFSFKIKEKSYEIKFVKGEKRKFAKIIILENGAVVHELNRVNRTPVSDEEFATIADFYAYDRSMPLDVEIIDAWPYRLPYTIEKITYRSINDQRVPAFFVYPDSAEFPRPAVLLLHGANSFLGKQEDWSMEWIDILAQAGYCVLVPDHPSFGERRGKNWFPDWYEAPLENRRFNVQTVTDLRRGIDYLFTRTEIDSSRIGLLGGSMGGWLGCLVAGLDSRLAAVVLIVTSTWSDPTDHPVYRAGQPLNFAPRITAPTLMVGATGDHYTRRQELFDALPEPKNIYIYDTDHYMPPLESNREAMDWFERYLH